ncbi:MAG TPA: class I SAM-dependent methyltransferase [Steroidobacteraceae bacterium]
MTPGDMELDGHYAVKQIHSRSRAVAWTHRGRFQRGLDVIARYGGNTLLDYGCGDATFMTMLLQQGTAPSTMVGCEIDDALVDDCRSRLRGAPGVSFERVDAVTGPRHAGRYDTVVCMEVLEHVVDTGAVLDHLGTLLSPRGTLVISVPVETGLPVLVKQTARRIAGWRGIGDYPGVTPYTPRELLAAVAAGARPHIARPVLHGDDAAPFHDHKGFNWMVLREEVARRFRLIDTLGSPVSWLPPHVNSQAWFVAVHR